jgi:formate dehydrogenase (NADP+) beta subunit
MKRFQVQLADRKWFEENVGCENACPVNTRAPQYTSAIRKGDYAVAFELNRGNNLFPAILGRICVHRCEEKCRGHLIDLPASICFLKRACVGLEENYPIASNHP